MTVLGDTGGWENRFATLEERMLERIVALWPGCIASLPAQPLEDTITIALHELLHKDDIARRLCYLEYQFEPRGLGSDGVLFSKGKIDMAAILDQDRDTYLAYECKRLNVTQTGGRTSLATPYVTEGIMRFVTEKYAEGLPYGCMLGYVLDRDVPFARQQVDAAIAGHPPAGVIEGPTNMAVSSGLTRFRTRHTRGNGSAIELRHSFLA